MAAAAKGCKGADVAADVASVVLDAVQGRKTTPTINKEGLVGFAVRNLDVGASRNRHRDGGALRNQKNGANMVADSSDNNPKSNGGAEKKKERTAGQFFHIGEQGEQGDASAKVGVELHPLDYWVLDTGAAWTMMPLKELLDDVRAAPINEVCSASGHALKVAGPGRAAFKGVDGKPVVLHDVLLVPDLKANLISLRKLAKAEVSTSTDGAHTYKGQLGNRVLWDLHESKDVYRSMWQLPALGWHGGGQAGEGSASLGECDAVRRVGVKVGGECNLGMGDTRLQARTYPYGTMKLTAGADVAEQQLGNEEALLILPHGYDPDEEDEHAPAPEEPASMEEALAGPDREKWLDSRDAEYQSLLENGTWDLVSMLVAKGFMQKEKQDFNEIFAPTAKPPTLRGEGEKLVLFVVYVDDILLFSSSMKEIQKVQQQLIKNFKCKILGEVKYYIEMHVERDLDHRWLKLHQEKFIKELGEKYGIENERKVATPLPTEFKLVKAAEDEGVGAEAQQQFQSLVGSLLYAAVHTRPDISFSVGQLARVVQNPSEEQVDAAERVVKYLNSHSSIGVQYSASAQVKQKGVEVLKEKEEWLGEGKLFLTYFTDATWAFEKDDSSSMEGYICVLGGGLVSWRSKKQTEMALSVGCKFSLHDILPSVCTSMRSLELNQRHHVMHLLPKVDCGPKAWTVLKELHAPTSVVATLMLERELSVLRLSEGEPVQPVFVKMHDLYAKLATAGITYPEQTKCLKMLSLLPES
ncbi:unnamed protein product [Closterium sp. NIES-53]